MSGSCVTPLRQNTGEKIYTRWRCHRPLCSSVFADRSGGRIDWGLRLCFAHQGYMTGCVNDTVTSAHTYYKTINSQDFQAELGPLQCWETTGSTPGLCGLYPPKKTKAKIKASTNGTTELSSQSLNRKKPKKTKVNAKIWDKNAHFPDLKLTVRYQGRNHQLFSVVSSSRASRHAFMHSQGFAAD